MDGASNLAIFRRIVVPLSVPALASFAIFQFLWVWNDLLMALVFLAGQPDQSTYDRAHPIPPLHVWPGVQPAERRFVPVDDTSL